MFLMSSTLAGGFFTLAPLGKPIPGISGSEESASNAGDLGSIPGSGRCPGVGNGKSFQYSCLENPVDKGAWWATVHGIAKVGYYLETKQQLNTNPQTGECDPQSLELGPVSTLIRSPLQPTRY